jgi:uncharacterized protein (DUF1501 family)
MSRFSQVNALAQDACPADYKALVCIFLFGGNDGNNTVVPISTPGSNPANSYSKYAQVRGGLALPVANLNVIGNSKGDQYGLHPSLTELASLYNNKNVAVTVNVGTLVTPLTQAQYKNQQAAIPSNLFSDPEQPDGEAASRMPSRVAIPVAFQPSSRWEETTCLIRAPRPTQRR